MTTDPTVRESAITLVDAFLLRRPARKPLSPAERAEVVDIALGHTCRQTAALAGASPETARSRRKRIYRKLPSQTARAIQVELLALSLEQLRRGA